MSILTTFTNIALNIKQKADSKNIAIYDQSKNQEVFTNVKYLEGSITDDLKMMEHPKEDGTTIIDHAINEANTGTIKLLIEDDDTNSLNEILDYYNGKIPLMIKIKNEIFTNLCISSKPVKADAEHYNSTEYNLSFKEVLQAVTQYVKMSVPQVKQVKNASTVKTGQKQPQPKPSILRIIANKITGKK